MRPSSWTADDDLVYEELQGAELRILAGEIDGAPEVKTLVDDEDYFDELQPNLSPDGR